MVEQNRGTLTQAKQGEQSQGNGSPGKQSQGKQSIHARRSEKRAHFLHKSLSRLLPARAGSKHGMIFLFFGVVLPIIAVGFELTTHFCAQHFFDPFPSSSHVVLFLLIPLSNFLAWLAGRRDLSAHYGFMSLISGMAMGIGCLYALMFLPLTPHSAFYTLFFGFGLLGLAPILAVPCTWLSGKTVCKLAESKRTFFDAHQVEHIGHLIVLCMVVAVELPSTLTRMNLSMAADPATEQQGIQWLRQFGSEEVMLRACYERSGRATDILGSLYEAGHPLSIDSARSIFYKVTGKPFNSVPIPSAARATIQHAGLIDDPNGLNADVKDEFDLDSDIAGENVSGVARGLAVSQTNITGKVDADAAVADMDWSVTFTNSSPYDREARAKLVLPPNGVVSKATVTINGVEHEATILVRSLARAIYKQSVADRRKDPLLVSTCGVNQILIQCYPVQPGVETVVHLKIEAPLVISEDKSTGTLVLPAFEERNFQFDRPVKVSFDSTAALELSPAQISRFEGTVNFKRNAAVEKVISRAAQLEARAFIPRYKTPDHLTILIDGSAAMARYMPELSAALKSFPASVNAEVVLVGDEVQVLGANSPGAGFGTAIGALEKYHAAGGQSDDNQLLNRLGTTPVLWIHGAQPINTNNTKLLNALLARPSETPWLYDFQTVSGPNELLNGLEPSRNFVSVPRTGKVQDDLNRLFHSWTKTAPAADAMRFVEWKPDIKQSAGEDSSTADKISGADDAHGIEFKNGDVAGLKELYGYERLLRSYESSDKTPALMLAQRYHLVSPFSSAVVLEYVPQSHPSPLEEGKTKADAGKLGLSSPVDLLTKTKKAFDAGNDRAERRIVDNLEPVYEKSSGASGARDEAQPADGFASGGAKDQQGQDASVNAPVLQGSTNGTVSSVEESNRVDGDRNDDFKARQKNEELAPQKEAISQDKGLHFAPAATAPTDPAAPYSALKPSAEPDMAPQSAPPPQVLAPATPARQGFEMKQLFAPQESQLEQQQSLSAPGSQSGLQFSNPQQQDMIKSAVGIFVLTFLWIYAFFKLLRAILRSRSN